MNYSIGLDIGTASVGWVCLDENFKVLSTNNRFAFGVHEFESAKVAAERRIQRGTRRRYNRRKKRIQLLQSLFIDHVDSKSNFFSTEKQMHFWKNDNQFENRTLSEVLKEMRVNPNLYPTIYHLRNYLLHTKEKQDLRLIYLSLHHLVKYRGHFLHENLEWNQSDDVIDLHEAIEALLERYNYLMDYNKPSFLNDEIIFIKETILNTKVTRNDRLKLLRSKVGKEYDYLFRLLLGLKASADKLFINLPTAEFYKENKIEINLTSEDYELQLSQLEELEAHFIEEAYSLFQSITLHDLLGGSKCIAEAKVKAYEVFEQQLRELKKIVDRYAGEEVYRKLFITPKKNLRQYEKEPKIDLLCLFDRYLKNKKSEDSFRNEVKKVLKSCVEKANTDDKSIINQLYVAIENDQFLIKQRSSHNAAIPHQNNVYEAKKIIENQQKYYKFMDDEWQQKVIELIKFRIPYYIGPLGESEFSWMERKSNENITPWNINKVVDRATSAEKFIERMTNQCTYLVNEKVLPKNSLTYEMFELLNELNNVQIRGKNEQSNRDYRLDQDVKDWAIQNIFMKFTNVTHNKFLVELKKYPGYQGSGMEGKHIFGTVKEDRFASGLKMHRLMEPFINKYGKEVVEDIIFMLTVFNEKEIIKNRIIEKYPVISNQDVEELSKINVSGWGRLSKKLVDGVRIDGHHTILEYMTKQPLNFMEVLSQTEAKEIIAKENPKRNVQKIKYSDIQQLAGSPALKRGIWRAVKIVEELTAIFGEPSNIMIEVAREDRNSTRTKSRMQQWNELGKEWKIPEWKAFYNQIASHPEVKFKDQRFWLYATQNGKCMYSGEPLDINELHVYEVDHIYPRSYVVDNSIDNLVLVKKYYNQRKGNTLTPLQVIPDKQKFRMIDLWEDLNSKRLISDKKLNRLKQLEFTDADKERFINRQLVETRQIIQNVRTLLEERFTETKIHLVKAQIVSRFRSALSIPKNRDYNNKHHAVDAFLMTVLIQYILQRFGENFLEFSFKQKERKNKWAKIAQESDHFFIFKDFQSERIKSLLQNRAVDSTEYIHEIVYELPWLTTKMTGSSEGMFYKETIYSPKIKSAKYDSNKAQKFVHDEVKNDKSICIQYDLVKKGRAKTEVKIFDLKVIESYQLKGKSLNEIAEYLVKRDIKNETKNITPLYELQKYQKIMIDQHPFYFISSDELHNAKQWVIPKHLVEKLSNLKDAEERDYLVNLFNDLMDSFFDQYPIYNTNTFKNKVIQYRDKEIVDTNSFNQGLLELYKSAAANATRSDKFGSRLNKTSNPNKLLVLYESITGLKYRKPKPVHAFRK